MTNRELCELLNDENRKISLKEFQEILYQFKEDCMNETYKLGTDDRNVQFYYGETNAFSIALDLSEHLDIEE